MRRRNAFSACFVLAASALLFCGCAGERTVDYREKETGNLVKTEMADPVEAKKMEPAEAGAVNFEDMGETASGTMQEKIIGVSAQEADLSGDEERKTVVSVGILAHVKDICGDGSMVISSDSNGFPGAYRVEVPGDVCDLSEMKGGDMVLVEMLDEEETDPQGLPLYLAERVAVLDGWEQPAWADILMTEPPDLELQDALSSTLDRFEVSPDNWVWYHKEGEEMVGVAACGSAPLDRIGMEDAEKFRLPRYNRMEEIICNISIGIAPDTLKVRRWSVEDIGKNDAVEEAVITYYYPLPMVRLRPGCVYEFAAVWEEENADRKGFCGDASYVVVTE